MMTDETTTNPRSEMARHLQMEVRAQKLLSLIETRCAHIRDGARQANQAYFHDQPGASAVASLWNATTNGNAPTSLSIEELNRYTRHWKGYLPDDPELRAVLIHLIASKYTLRRGIQRRLQAALGVDDPQTQAAYQALYEQPLENIFQSGADTVPVIGSDPEHAMSDAFTEVAQEWDLLNEDEALEWVTLPSGSLLYKEGDPGDALYILISGRLRVAVANNSTAQAANSGAPLPANGNNAAVSNLPSMDAPLQERALQEIGRGEMVGAMEVLTGEPRATRVYATRDSELVRISQANLQRLSEKRPQVMRRMVAYLASRLKDQLTPTKKGANSLVTFALLRTGNHSVADTTDPQPAFMGPLEDFPAQFAQALSSFGPTLLLNSRLLDRQAGPGLAQTNPQDEGSAWLSAYLSEQETHYRYIVYETDAGATPWTRRCLRQADRVILVGATLPEVNDDPRPGGLEDLLAGMEMPPAVELALVHPANTAHPAGTRHWLAGRTLSAHHHLRLGNPDDLGRLARRLTGRALGLVLSGGGARGFAHIGVLKAMQEAGLTVDVVCGTSMGSIVSALYAMDYSVDQMLKLVRQFSSPTRLFDLTLPLVSFFKSGKITEVLQHVFGDTHIEDLWRPYFCLSTNLTRARERIHVQGPLWQAVRASSAIPGVFSPVLEDGDLLVDGAVLNNLPVDVMQDFAGCGPMAAINVFPEVDLVREYDFGNSVSGWDVLLRRLNPFSANPSAPLIFESLLRVISLNDVHLAKAKSQMCELYITPQVERFGILEFKSYAKIIDIGYRSGTEAIEAWSKGQEPERIPVTQTLAQTLEQLELVLDQMAA